MNDFRIRKTHVSAVRAPGFICEEVAPDVLTPLRVRLSLATYLRGGYCAACGQPFAWHGGSRRRDCEVMILAFLGVAGAFAAAVRHLILNNGSPVYETRYRRPLVPVDPEALKSLLRSWKGRR